MLELCIPVEIVAPAFMQVVRREATPAPVKEFGRRDKGRNSGKHIGVARRAAALSHVAWRAGGGDILPVRPPAKTPRQHVIKRQLLGRAAILAAETVAKKKIETREGWLAALADIMLQADDARQAHFKARRADHPVIFRDDVDAIQKDRLQGVLPRPE